MKKFLNRMRFVLPSALPTQSTEEFDRFADSIFDTYGFPNLPSYRQAIAAQIMHLPVLCTHKPKRMFARSVRKAMANQISYEVINAIREQEKQAAVVKAAAEPVVR